MARRRQEIALQTEIETQEEWTQMINKEGLTGDCREGWERGVEFSSHLHVSLYRSHSGRRLPTMGRGM